MSNLVGFGTPSSVLTGGQTFSQENTDINSGFGAVTPPPATSPVGTAPATSDPTLSGPSGFNLPGAAAQNIVTDPNLAGVTTPGMTTYGPDSLKNPNSGYYPQQIGDAL